MNIGIIISSDSIFQVGTKTEGNIVVSNRDSSYVYQNDIVAIIVSDSILSISGICKIPTNKINEIKRGQKISVAFSSGKNYMASVSSLDNIQQKDITTGYSYFKVMIQFDTKLDTPEIFDSMAEGKILVSDMPILKLILQ